MCKQANQLYGGDGVQNIASHIFKSERERECTMEDVVGSVEQLALFEGVCSSERVSREQGPDLFVEVAEEVDVGGAAFRGAVFHQELPEEELGFVPLTDDVELGNGGVFSVGMCGIEI